jgi:DNA repair photolyase
MKFIPIQQCDLTKTDATTVVAYRDNVTISASMIRGDYPFNVIIKTKLALANRAVELILNEIFNKQG